jgi:hypothetical protein
LEEESIKKMSEERKTIAKEIKEIENQLNNSLINLKSKHPSISHIFINEIVEGNSIGRTEYGKYDINCAINQSNL